MGWLYPDAHELKWETVRDALIRRHASVADNSGE